MESAWHLGPGDGWSVSAFREALIQQEWEAERTHFKENNVKPRKTKPFSH